ncbi:uncharacterized protein LOC128962579 [Oppia nitens]|uniref:uncharacterized protein LOC128962579 n=1 Tax=Oppia nitens TaxID=1686743 RepID=UPI0023D9B4E1|nr:uncharacterized protein LOC128962579 [Oppia nitens]
MMTICKFYVNGFCRYGNNCRFEHISDTNHYYHKNYQRFDGRQSNQSLGTNKVGFSFNKTFDKITNQPNMTTGSVFSGQRLQMNSNSSNIRPNETSMTSPFARNSFQFGNTTPVATQRTGGFSFNKTLQQISNNDGQHIDDTDMESVPVIVTQQHSRPQMIATHELQMDSNLGFINQSNVNQMTKISPKISSNVNPNAISQNLINSSVKSNDEIYSKESDLSLDNLRQFECNSFSFKSIPICPPPQSLCF